MPKIQAVTDEMKAIADRIGENVSAMVDSQTSVKNCMSSILVHFDSKPKVLTTIHLANVTNGYRNSGESLTGYQEFLVNAANTYEWNDEQMAKWGDVMQNEKGVDIHNYHSPNIVPEGGWDASGGWDTVGDTFPHKRPDLSSSFYDRSSCAKQLSSRVTGDHGSDSIDCCFYARSRAMEVRGWTQTYGTFSWDTSVDAIKTGDRVVCFNTKNGNHFVYVETYDANTDTVYFSDANMGGSPATDGRLQSKSLNDFLTYCGTYHHTEIP